MRNALWKGFGFDGNGTRTFEARHFCFKKERPYSKRELNKKHPKGYYGVRIHNGECEERYFETAALRYAFENFQGQFAQGVN